MGILIAFEAHRRRSGPRTTPGGPAAVLLFTGVRYDRRPIPAPDAPAPDRVDLAARKDRPTSGPRGSGRTGRRRRA